MKYRPVYKCALCGEQHFGNEFYSETKEAIRYAASHPGFVTEVLHDCADGSIGIAPFIGFKMEVDLDEEEEGLADDE